MLKESEMIRDWEINDWSGIHRGVLITDPDLSDLIAYLRGKAQQGMEGQTRRLYEKLCEAKIEMDRSQDPIRRYWGSLSEKSHC